MPGSDNNGSRSPKGLSRRKFLLGSAATAAGAAVTVSSERADAFFNLMGFMKKPAGNGQTSNGYVIDYSCRFRSAGSTYLTRTPTVAGNTQTFTLSMWLKRTNPNTYQCFFNAGGNGFVVRFSGAYGGNGDFLEIYAYGSSNDFSRDTAQLFRDPSAWGHLILVGDMTNSTAANKFLVYWNGTQITSFTQVPNGMGPINPSGTSGIQVNTATAHYLGGNSLGSPYYFDGYMAEVNFVDGQALTPSSFGQVDTNSGQWIPKKYSGAYGSQGYYLNFSNSANLGQDSSGNGNNWTASGLQAYDQVIDSPTNNFAALNRLATISGITLSNGNLTAYNPSNNFPHTNASIAIKVPTYWETYHQTDYAGGSTGIVEGLSDCLLSGTGYRLGQTSTADSIGLYATTNQSTWVYQGNSTLLYTTSAVASNITTSWAYDPTTGKLWIGINGSWLNSGNPANGTNPMAILTAGKDYFPSLEPNGGYMQVQFGQGGQAGLTYDAASGGRFKYTPPAGFKALCTVNLPSNMPVVTSGTFTGNANADGPFVWLGGAPTDLTINGNAVTWGTHADKLASGFKIRTSSASYNAGGSNSFSATVPAKFKWTTARANP